MPRTVVPPVRFRGEKESGVGGDDFPVRMAKYVPAETLAFFVPAAAWIGSGNNAALTAVVLIGLLGTIGYLWLAGQRAEPDERPLPHFYALAGLAYLCWTVGVSSHAAALVHLDATVGGVVLTAAVFLIPMLDDVGNRLLGRVA